MTRCLLNKQETYQALIQSSPLTNSEKEHFSALITSRASRLTL